MKKSILLATTFLISLTGICQEKVDERDLLELKNRMEGYFISHSKSSQDSAHHDTHVHITQIWPRSENGYWLYVEEAADTALRNPYRQHIYRVYTQDAITLAAKDFEIEQPLRFAGAYANTELLKGFTKDSLLDIQGCALYFRKDKSGNFFGGTNGKNCLNNVDSAAYTTSTITWYEDKFVRLDKGWNKENKQVWGSEKAGLDFSKQKEE